METLEWSSIQKVIHKYIAPMGLFYYEKSHFYEWLPCTAWPRLLDTDDGHFPCFARFDQKMSGVEFEYDFPVDLGFPGKIDETQFQIVMPPCEADR